MTKFLERFIPARLRRRKELTPEERLALFAQVNDANPCLRAVEDILEEKLATEFSILTDQTRADVDKLRACEGMRVIYFTLQQIEEEREMAKKWLEKQQQ